MGVVDLLAKFEDLVIFKITFTTSALTLSPTAFSRTYFASPEDSGFKCTSLSQYYTPKRFYMTTVIGNPYTWL